jgi:hypothetical protein
MAWAISEMEEGPGRLTRALPLHLQAKQASIPTDTEMHRQLSATQHAHQINPRLPNHICAAAPGGLVRRREVSNRDSPGARKSGRLRSAKTRPQAVAIADQQQPQRVPPSSRRPPPASQQASPPFRPRLRLLPLRGGRRAVKGVEGGSGARVGNGAELHVDDLWDRRENVGPL